jgi:hypothetical protein
VSVAAAIVIAAAVHALAGGGDSAALRESTPLRVRGPDVPAPDALSGTLVLATSPGCRLAELDLATLVLVQREVRGDCRRLPAERSSLLVVDRRGERGVYEGGQMVLGEKDLRSGLDRAPSGHVHPLGADRRADGLLGVSVSAAPRGIDDVLEDAGIDPSDVSDLSEARKLLGLNGPYGAIALSAAGSLPRTELQLWRGRRLEEAHPLRAAAYPFANRRFGELLDFSPDGSELALGHAGAGAPVLLLDVATLRTTLRPTLQHGFAWSPDGAYFALSTGAEIRISGAVRSQVAYVLPMRAILLSWREEARPS